LNSFRLTTSFFGFGRGLFGSTDSDSDSGFGLFPKNIQHLLLIVFLTNFVYYVKDAVWKPKGPTSYDIIRELKKVLPKGVKIGHAGTLDPLASGVLVIGVGREATKDLSEAVGAEKEYIAKIRFGESSTTDDEEGEKKIFKLEIFPRIKQIEEILLQFTGKIIQMPPAFSALKVNGKTAYSLARKGRKVNLKPREVWIKKIEILSYGWPYLILRVTTGPGVYIRALARDLGELLAGGGYLADLERTQVGSFDKKTTLTVEGAAEKLKKFY